MLRIQDAGEFNHLNMYSYLLSIAKVYYVYHLYLKEMEHSGVS